MALPAPPQRVLIYRLGSLGDTVIALPAFHLIAQRFPEAERRLLTSFPPNAKAPASSAILEGTGLVHGYFRYSLRTRSVRELARLWWELLRWRPEVLVYLAAASGIPDARRNALFFRLCGVRRMIGVPLTEDLQRSRERPALPGEARTMAGTILEPECSRLLRTLAPLGEASLDSPDGWDLCLQPHEHARASEALAPLGGRPFFAVSFGTKNQSNEWEEPNWHALLARLALAYPGHALVLSGAPVESDSSEAAAEVWRGRSAQPALNLCGGLSPRESAAVFRRATLFLGHDSGPMHLAAAAGATCIGIYGSRNLPGAWFPYGRQHHILYHAVSCENCRLQTCTLEAKRCILSITVDEVLTEVGRALSRKPAAAPPS